MGFFDILSGALTAVGSMSSGTSLQEAARSAPNEMGCYKLRFEGELVYVGKAEDGLRKRFVQYYNGTTAHYTSARLIYEHRDEITAQWQICKTRSECRSLEARWIDLYNPKWNAQSGWKNY